MKKLLLTLGISALTLTSALAQGTINPLNSVISRVKICEGGSTLRNATAADGLRFSIWFGPARSMAGDLAQIGNEAVIGTTVGVITGWPSLFVIPQAQPGEAVSLQIRMRNDVGLYWSTDVRQVTPNTGGGPGTIIWQQASGVSPNRFTPLTFPCPEPSTLALGALAGAFLVFRLRQSTKAN